MMVRFYYTKCTINKCIKLIMRIIYITHHIVIFLSIIEQQCRTFFTDRTHEIGEWISKYMNLIQWKGKRLLFLLFQGLPPGHAAGIFFLLILYMATLCARQNIPSYFVGAWININMSFVYGMSAEFWFGSHCENYRDFFLFLKIKFYMDLFSLFYVANINNY